MNLVRNILYILYMPNEQVTYKIYLNIKSKQTCDECYYVHMFIYWLWERIMHMRKDEIWSQQAVTWADL